MKKLLHYALILALLCGITNTQAKNLKIHVSTAGTLKTVLGSNSTDASITELTITGNLKDNDFDNLKSSLKGLRILDLSDVSVPNNTLPTGAFMGHRGLEELILPKNLKIIANWAFEDTHISKPLVLPTGLEEIRDGVFDMPRAQMTIDFSKCKNNLKKIGSMAFSYDPFYINNGYFDFSDFNNLTDIKDLGSNGQKVILPNNMTSVPIRIAMQYDGCVELSDKTTYIGDYAFYNYGGAAKEIIVRATTPPKLGKDVFSSNVYKYTTLRVPKEFIALYKKTDGWKDFLNISQTEYDVDNKITIHYHGPQQNVSPFNAVRIGEYYWMSEPYRETEWINIGQVNWGDPSGWNAQGYIGDNWSKMHDFGGQEAAKAMNLYHERAWMFEYAKGGVNYFDEYGNGTISQKVDSILKYYGTYFTPLYHYWIQNNKINSSKDYRYGIKENNNNEFNTTWDLPSTQDMLQLFAMCGNATHDEIRIHLSPQDNGNPNNPSVVIPAREYMGWFNKTIAPGLSDKANSNHFDAIPTGNQYAPFSYVVKEQYHNRYGFNLYPAGARLHSNDGIALTNHETGNTITYSGQAGDLNGFNQTAYLMTKNMGHAIIHDWTDIKEGYNYYWSPIRLTRPLTDEELGYKLYINVKDYVETELFFKNLYNNHVSGSYKVEIKKTKLDEQVGENWFELPKGILRGFYVQYMIEYPEGKTIEDLLKIANNLNMEWPNKKLGQSTRAALATDAPSAIETGFTAEEISVYPNPVIDVLNINGYNEVTGLQLYNSAGNLVVKQDFANPTLDMSHLSEGVYIIKLQTKQGTFTQKIIKR